jgi:hypothetical protein
MTAANTEPDDEMSGSGWLRIPDREPRPLRLGYEAQLDGRAVIGRLSRELRPVAADLLEIAAMAYAADRLVARPSERECSDGSGWGRQLWLEVPVRNPSLWHSITEQLTALLGWLTDDQWTIDFSQLADGTGPLDSQQGFLFDTVPRASQLALFSGGLDSALGLAHDLASSDAVVVSVYTNNRMKAAQRQVVHALDRDASTSCVQLQYRISLGTAERENSGDTAFAARVSGPAHCGTCTSCLLRRQALIAGGRSDADELTQYRRRSPAGTASLVAMTWQLERLRDCLNEADQWRGIVSEFPHIMDVERLTPAQVTRLYGAYVREWEAVDLASFGVRGDRSAALCETKSDQS